MIPVFFDLPRQDLGQAAVIGLLVEVLSRVASRCETSLISKQVSSPVTAAVGLDEPVVGRAGEKSHQVRIRKFARLTAGGGSQERTRL